LARKVAFLNTLLRDMQGMCSMGGHWFDPGSMPDTLGRVRAGLREHHRRMAGTNDLNALRTEEETLRGSMTGLMAEMHGREADFRSVAGLYTCRMHAH
jgi:hypothetical protein